MKKPFMVIIKIKDKKPIVKEFETRSEMMNFIDELIRYNEVVDVTIVGQTVKEDGPYEE